MNAAASSELIWIFAAYAVLGLGWGGMIPMQKVLWSSLLVDVSGNDSRRGYALRPSTERLSLVVGIHLSG